MYGLIALVDQSKRHRLSDTDGNRLAAALAAQIRYHVQPHYRQTAAPVVWYGQHVETVPARAWQVVAFDDPDQADALGYHDLQSDGLPYARIFNEPTLDAGLAPSTVWSHEVIEAFVDPWAGLWAWANAATSIAYEACDPVQASSYSYRGVELSNFVTRAWFNPSDRVGPFDYLSHLHAPFTLEDGGYMIRERNGRVDQVFADKYPQWRRDLIHAPQPSRTAWREVRELT